VPSSVALAKAYRAETEKLTAERLPRVFGIFLILVAIAGGLEYTFRPRHFAFYALFYAGELTVIGALLLLRKPLHRRELLGDTNILVWAVLSCLLHGYGYATDLPVEFAALTSLCMIMGPSLAIPWGVRGQTVLATVSVASLTAQLVATSDNPASFSYPFFADAAGGVLSILGARTFDLYRFAIFCEVMRSERQASIHRRLVAVAKEINERLDDVDLLDHIAAVARSAIACDWVMIFARGGDEHVARVIGADGHLPSSKENLRSLELSAEDLPWLERVIAGENIGVLHAHDADAATAAVMASWAIRELRATPLRHRAKIVGAIVAGSAQPSGSGSGSTAQLLEGIAEHAAIALANHLLVFNLRQASHTKSEFLATMSHELRTPLHVVVGFTDLLRDGVFGELNGEQQQALGRLRHNSLTLIELVEATLEANRIEAGRAQVRRRDIDLASLLEEIQHDTAYLPRRPGVQLRWELPARTATPHTDPTKIKIILKNLIGNALKFTDRGTVTVRVLAHPAAQRLELIVQDTGRGIPQEELPHIFDMFRQVKDDTTIPLVSGVGLGLFIVHRFVEQLGGRVSVSSAQRQGSTFHVELPMGIHPLDTTERDEHRDLVA
jgi:signal transduction histidine kinase